MRGSDQMSSQSFLEDRHEQLDEISDLTVATASGLTRVNDYPGDGGAVATNPLGCAMHDNICAMLNGANQVT